MFDIVWLRLILLEIVCSHIILCLILLNVVWYCLILFATVDVDCNCMGLFDIV